jgi:hypothetical protein
VEFHSKLNLKVRQSERDEGKTSGAVAKRSAAGWRNSGSDAFRERCQRGEGCPIKVFQQLPLYVRRRVLKEGIVLFVKDEDELYELAFRTAKEFEDFKHIYRNYLEAIAHG